MPGHRATRLDYSRPGSISEPPRLLPLIVYICVAIMQLIERISKIIVEEYALIEDTPYKPNNASELLESLHIKRYSGNGAVDSIPAPELVNKMKTFEENLSQIKDWTKTKEEDTKNKILSPMRCTGQMMDEHDELKDKVPKMEKPQSTLTSSTRTPSKVNDSKTDSDKEENTEIVNVDRNEDKNGWKDNAVHGEIHAGNNADEVGYHLSCPKWRWIEGETAMGSSQKSDQHTEGNSRKIFPRALVQKQQCQYVQTFPENKAVSRTSKLTKTNGRINNNSKKEIPLRSWRYPVSMISMPSPYVQSPYVKRSRMHIVNELRGPRPK